MRAACGGDCPWHTSRRRVSLPAPGPSEDRSLAVDLPGEISGPWRLFIRSDAEDAVEEADGEADNDGEALEVEIAPLLAAALRVEAVSGPTGTSWGDDGDGHLAGWAMPARLAGTEGAVDQVSGCPATGCSTATTCCWRPWRPARAGPRETYVTSNRGHHTRRGHRDLPADRGHGHDGCRGRKAPTRATTPPRRWTRVDRREPRAGPRGERGGRPARRQPGRGGDDPLRVDNIGEGPARAPFTDMVYPRPAARFPGRVISASGHARSICGGDFYEAALDVTLPSLDAGTWSVLVVTDGRANVFELGREDITAVAAVPFGISAPISTSRP